MKKLITLLCVFLITFCGHAQSDTTHYLPKSKWAPLSTANIHAAVAAGAGVSLFNSGQTSTFTFIAPSVQYQFNKKFAFSAGVLHYNITGSPFINRGFGENYYGNNSKNYTGNIVQVGGIYEMNARLSFFGSGMYQVNPYYNRTNVHFNSTSLGLNYKVNEHTSFSIKANIIRGNTTNSLYCNPACDPYAMPSNGNTLNRFNAYQTILPSNF